MKKLKEEVAKTTPRFRQLLEKVSKVGMDQGSQHQLRAHLDDFKKLLSDTRLSLVHMYHKVLIACAAIDNSMNWHSHDSSSIRTKR